MNPKKPLHILFHPTINSVYNGTLSIYVYIYHVVCTHLSRSRIWVGLSMVCFCSVYTTFGNHSQNGTQTKLGQCKHGPTHTLMPPSLCVILCSSHVDTQEGGTGGCALVWLLYTDHIQCMMQLCGLLVANGCIIHETQF